MKSVSKDTPITFCIGTPWSGKSETGKILGMLTSNDPHYAILDTSKVIAQHEKRQTRFGQEFTRLKDMQTSGDLYPAEPIFGALMDDLYNWPTEIAFIYMIGAPRDVAQVQMFLEYFRNANLVYAKNTADNALLDLDHRPRGENRLDDTPERIARRFIVAERITDKAMAEFSSRRRNSLLTLSRTDTMSLRMKQLVNHLLVPEHIRVSWTNMCRDRNHPAGARILRLEQEDQEFRRARKRARRSAGYKQADHGDPSYHMGATPTTRMSDPLTAARA